MRRGSWPANVIERACAKFRDKVLLIQAHEIIRRFIIYGCSLERRLNHHFVSGGANEDLAPDLGACFEVLRGRIGMRRETKAARGWLTSARITTAFIYVESRRQRGR